MVCKCRDGDRDGDNVAVAGLLQEVHHRRARDAELIGDLFLRHALLVVEPRRPYDGITVELAGIDNARRLMRGGVTLRCSVLVIGDPGHRRQVAQNHIVVDNCQSARLIAITFCRMSRSAAAAMLRRGLRGFCRCRQQNWTALIDDLVAGRWINPLTGAAREGALRLHRD